MVVECVNAHRGVVEECLPEDSFLVGMADVGAVLCDDEAVHLFPQRVVLDLFYLTFYRVVCVVFGIFIFVP